MFNKLIMLGIAAGIFAAIPVLYETNPDAFQRLILGEGREASDQAPSASLSMARTRGGDTLQSGRQVQLRDDGRGHFVADFRLNGRSVEAMVDTGATLVAINRSTARRIGLSLGEADFVHAVQTANGEARAASAVIDTMRIGRIEVSDVQAVVLEDDALSATLVGMSFLGRLRRYGVERETMILEQ